jgi:hypothetical protein
MALPEPFSDIEHLQLTIRRYCNKQIREDFRDMFGTGDSWEPEVGTTRGAMLRALLHEDSDPITTTLLRMFLYYFTYGKAQMMQTPVFGIPVNSYDTNITYKPQIKLYFRQNSRDVEENKTAVEGELTFRLINDTTTTISNTEVDRYAQRIATNFAKPTRFIWQKGKHRFTYADRAKGYQLSVNVISETEGKRVVEQILDIQQHTPNWKYAKYIETVEPNERYPEQPSTQTILGKSRRKPRQRPREDVKFVRASLLIPGLPSPITLVDTTGKYRNARIYA